MKPILTISDFSRGIVDDQTLSVKDGFSEMYGVDIKTFPGVLQATYKMSGPYTSSASNVCCVAKLPFDQHSEDLAMKAFGVSANSANSNVYSNVGDGTAWSVFRSITSTLNVAFPEVISYNNHLVYPNGRGSIGTAYCYAAGTISVTTGSTTITLTGGAWTADLGDGYGGTVFSTVYIDNGAGVFQSFSFQFTGSATSATIGTAYAGSTGSGRKYYIVAFNDTGIGIGPVSLTLTNQTSRYRPMVEKDNQLYVADGWYIHRFNPALLTFTKVLDLGTDYTIKKMVRNGEWLYILADKNPDALAGLGGTKSFLFIWDGATEAVNRAIPFDCSCFSIIAAENIIWSLTEARSQLGAGDLSIRYFNGSDFTVAKHITLNRYLENFQFGNAYPHSLTAYNGSLYVGVRNGNAYNRCGIYEYSAFDNEGKSLVFRQYQNEPSCLWILPSSVGKDRLMCEASTGEWISAVASEDRFYTDTNGNKPYVVTNWYFITGDQFPQKVRAASIDFFESLIGSESVTIEVARDGGSFSGAYSTILPSNQNLPVYFEPKLCQSIRLRITITTNGVYTPRIKNIRLY